MVNDRARAFKALSPGMLPPLGILFALLVGFIAVEVWNNYDKAKLAVVSEASALRAVVLLSETFPDEQKTRFHSIDSLCDRHGPGDIFARRMQLAFHWRISVHHHFLNQS